MSKKGRVGGTIGFILALALVGGTIAYSTMFDPYAAAKTKKPVGEATGNVISAYSSQEGFEKTKQLVNDTMGTWFAPVQANAVYKSYTLDFSIYGETTLTVEGETTVETMETKGSIYSDENYTFIKVNSSQITAGKVQYTYEELFYVKSNNATFERTLSYAQNPQDTSIIKDVEWEQQTTASSDVELLGVIIGGLFQSADFWEFNVITGQFELKDEYSDDVQASFTVGFSPRILLTNTEKEDDVGPAVVYSSYAFHYSNLNNTVVNVPETLKNKVGA